MIDAAQADVSELIDDFGAALHARDVEASMALLADEPDLAVIPSEGVQIHRGPQQTREFLGRIYDGPRRYGWDLPNRQIAVEGSVAWFVASGDETLEQDGVSRRIPYCLTGVAVRAQSGWRFRLLHASEDIAR